MTDGRVMEELARVRRGRFRLGLGVVGVSVAAIVGGAAVGLATGGEGDVATAAGVAPAAVIRPMDSRTEVPAEITSSMISTRPSGSVSGIASHAPVSSPEGSLSGRLCPVARIT